MRRLSSRLVFSLLFLLIAVTPLAAQTQVDPRTAPSDSVAALNSRPLFVVVPAAQLADRQTLLFTIRLNGKPYLEETLLLDSSRSGNAFELLATHPEMLERLYQLAKDRSNRLAVSVSLDGRVVRAFSSFEDFYRYNRTIKATSLAIRQSASLVHDSTAPAAPSSGLHVITGRYVGPDPECADQCYANYDICYDGGNGCDYGDCSRCQSWLDACLSNCPTVCIDPKSYSDSTTTQLISTTIMPYGSGCLRAQVGTTFGFQYIYYEKQYKHTTTRTSKYCDGHTSSEVISVWYSTTYCYGNQGSICWNPSGLASPLCQ